MLADTDDDAYWKGDNQIRAVRLYRCIYAIETTCEAICNKLQGKAGKVGLVGCIHALINHRRHLFSKKYIHQSKKSKPAQPMLVIPKQISSIFFKKPPKSSNPLSTPLRSSPRLSVFPSTIHPLPFHISAQRRNINYYQYQFRHMNTDESISLSTSQNIVKLDRNHLLLKGNTTAYFKQEVIIDFEPVKAIDPFLSPPRLSSFSIIPTFNRDSKYYTLAFINPFDADQEEEDAKIRTQHETRVKEYSTQIAEEDILMPKPRHSDPFCGVCRQGFVDYLEHINSSKHDNKVKKSRFSKFIVELGEDLFPQARKSRRLISKGRK